MDPLSVGFSRREYCSGSSCECGQGWRLRLWEAVTQRWCHDHQVEQRAVTALSVGFCPWFTEWGPGAAGPPSKVQCKRKGTSCICSVWLFVFLIFFCVCFSLQLLNLYAQNLKPQTYIYPLMGIITVLCRGSVVSHNTQNAVFSLVFPELCFFQSFFQGKLNDLVGAEKKPRILEWVVIPFSKGSNPSLPHCRQILYPLSHQGSP